MAQEIVASLFGHFIAGPGMKIEFADQTATATGLQFGSGGAGGPDRATWILAMIYQKAFTAGTGTADVLYDVEVADDLAFTSNVRSVGRVPMARADEQTQFVQGFAPVGAQKFVRIKQAKDGTDAATYDAIVVGVG